MSIYTCRCLRGIYREYFSPTLLQIKRPALQNETQYHWAHTDEENGINMDKAQTNQDNLTMDTGWRWRGRSMFQRATGRYATAVQNLLPRTCRETAEKGDIVKKSKYGRFSSQLRRLAPHNMMIKYDASWNSTPLI